MEQTIKAIANNNQMIGVLKTIKYVDIAIEHGHDAETIQVLLRMFLEDMEEELEC